MKYTVKTLNGNTYWYKEGTNILHREDGPAIEYFSGNKSWYLEGEKYTEEEFLKLISQKETYEGKFAVIKGIKYML